jgi:hypothetical protein
MARFVLHGEPLLLMGAAGASYAIYLVPLFGITVMKNLRTEQPNGGMPVHQQKTRTWRSL